ncbi:MAG TPA: MEDS domain-containing protein [Actinomycetota bacterium]|nr:MEDS domain-containing protein [Actinomycetota bacterium]
MAGKATTTTTRRTAALREAADLRLGDHICWTYSSDEEHRTVLTAFVAEALQAGQQIAHFAPRGEELRLVEYLRECGVDAAALIDEGRLVLGSAEKAYYPKGIFDPEESLLGFRAMAEQARVDGYTGLRVAGENGWILADWLHRATWPGYEVRVDRVIAGLPLIGMCSFDLRECGEQIVELMDAVHPVRLGNSSTTSAFHLHSNPDDGLVIRGQLDLATSQTVESLLQSLAGHEVISRIDLSGLSFADVQGMRAIAAGARAIAEKGGMLRLEDPPTAFSKAWRLLRLDEAVPAELVASGSRG